MLRKAVTYLFIAIVICFILAEPSQAGATGRVILGGLRDAGDSLTSFVANLGKS